MYQEESDDEKIDECEANNYWQNCSLKKTHKLDSELFCIVYAADPDEDWREVLRTQLTEIVNRLVETVNNICR